MSFGVVAAVAVGVSAASAVMNYKNQKDAASEQKKANARATAEAKRTADLADQATNKANRKGPNIANLMAGNAMTKGVGSTSLTGPGGIDTSSLTLGRSTLLGG